MINRKLYFISGYPGTSKTTMGNYLAEKHGYVHIDMEEKNNTSSIIDDIDVFVKNNFDGNFNVVATGGFSPDHETLSFLKKLSDYGFKIFGLSVIAR